MVLPRGDPVNLTRLTKTKYMCGLQCHKRLWWEMHEPEAPELEPDAALQALFDSGSRVGEIAREHVPGGVLIDVPYYRPAERVEATRRALAAGATVVYEAAFREDNIFVATDILSRRARGRFTLTEVKSSTEVKPQYLSDAAVQTYVARRAGLVVDRVELMHLNRACTYPDLSNLFVRANVTAKVERLLPDVPAEAARQLAMLRGPLPDVEPGAQCSSPYECPFIGRCCVEPPEHHVSTLYGLKPARKEALLAEGYETILDLSADLKLTAVQQRQRRAVTEGALLVERGLTAALDQIVRPVAYLDFETVALAIPCWDGCHPYDGIPAQVSVHREGLDGEIESSSWIAEGLGDPRPACGAFVAEALAGATTVVAYNAPFEKRCLGLLADAAPRHRKALSKAAESLVDLLPVVRDHVYHPGFHGSFSLKRVLPALVPSLGYDDLEIAEGMAAARELERLMFDEDIPRPERKKLREALLRYCARDTAALVRLVSELRVLAERRCFPSNNPRPPVVVEAWVTQAPPPPPSPKRRAVKPKPGCR
jgi:predicted RecB family nuclease